MTKHYYTKGLDIPQDADSVRYFIPEGYTARFEDGVLIIEPKESEDEKIIKEIIHYLYTSEGLSTEEQTRWISYLGKQKEPTEELSTRLNGLMQEYVKSGKDEEEQEHRLKCYHLFWDALGDSEFFKQKKQKPPITGNDFGWIDELEHDLEYPEELDQKVDGVLKQRKGIRALEWSEEDERMLSRCIKSVECSKQFADSETYKAAKDVEMTWLKSLKNIGNSPKSNTNSHWKPSEEQMDRLFSIVAALRKDYCDDMADFLANLYKDLKKLI